MGDVVLLREVEFQADEGIGIVAGLLADVLAEARAGRVEAVAIALVSRGGVQTRWAMKPGDGHGHLLVSGASRLVHDMHALTKEVPSLGEGDGA